MPKLDNDHASNAAEPPRTKPHLGLMTECPLESGSGRSWFWQEVFSLAQWLGFAGLLVQDGGLALEAAFGLGGDDFGLLGGHGGEGFLLSLGLCCASGFSIEQGDGDALREDDLASFIGMVMPCF